MFPLDQCTAYFQSAVEAEYDVGALVIAMRASPLSIRHIVLKYVITAELSFIDALEAVFTSQKGDFWRRFPKTTELGDAVRTMRHEFEVAKQEVASLLRRTVRLRGSAHKEVYFVETEAEMMRTLNSREPARLFALGRGVVDFLAARPIWTWGYSYPGGGIGALLATCGRPIVGAQVPEPPDGFGLRGYSGLGPHDVVEEHKFDSFSAARSWADGISYSGQSAVAPVGPDGPPSRGLMPGR